jgi:acylphosphatase
VTTDPHSSFACLERRRVRYTGRVQGVGFRASTNAIATGRPLVGFVRNEPDGSVLLEVQGTATDVEAFLADVRLRLARFIRGEDESTLPLQHGESSFEITG